MGIIQNNQNNEFDNSKFKSFLGIKFESSQRSYFFGIEDSGDKYQIGDKVIVETARGLELGEVTIEPMDMKKYTNNMGLKPVIRRASEVDLKVYEVNQRDAKYALEVCQSEAKSFGLDMTLISCEYTLDRSKVIFSYVADERVDFRELLKVLASRLHTRIELRQIGSRDKAKMVGGLGVCGLPLCCSTFLNEFDGISINRAKNQMLAINIPKLSGQCGKLICCLKYEDETYTNEKQYLPDLGTKVFIDKIEYTVSNVNIVSKVIRVENEDDVKYLDVGEFKKQTHWKRKKDRNEEKQKF